MKVTCIQEHNGRFGHFFPGEYDLDDKGNELVADAYKAIPQIFEKKTVKKAAKKVATKVAETATAKDAETR